MSLISATLMTVLNASTDAVVIIDKSSRIRAVNTMATRMFGFTEAQMVGQDVGLLMPEQYRTIHQSLVQRYLDTHVAKVIGIGRPLQALHSNGTEFAMFLTLTEIVDGDEHLFCGFVKNISERGPGSDAFLRSASRSSASGDASSDNWLPRQHNSSSSSSSINNHSNSNAADSYWAEITPKDKTEPETRVASSGSASSRFSSTGVDEVREIDYSEIVFDSDKPLGKGAFGVVFKAQWRGVSVAVKQLLQFVDDEVLEQIRGECMLLQKCNNHPNVIKFIGMVRKGATICIVTQFCAKGSLHQAYIVRRDPFTHAETCRILRDAALGVLHLHKEHVIHRDIAARNILLDEHDHVFVTDFGLARVKTSAYASTKSSIGPVQHMAPESIAKKQFSEKSDVFAFAVLMWEVTHRRDPYAGEEAFQIAMGVVQGTRLDVDEQLAGSAAVAALMRQSWKSQPSDRPEMTDIINVLRNEIDEEHQRASSTQHVDSN
jgi:PAS domain S-box-containing protein